jgi:hypothetical protein
LTFKNKKIPIKKKDIFLILNAMGDQWKKNRLKNADYILAINSIKLGMHIQSDRAVERIINDMVHAVNALQQLGAFSDLKNDESMDDRVEFFRDRLIAEIKSGEFFKGIN